MSDQPTLHGQSEPPSPRRRRRNRWEVALWILGAALIAISLAAAYLVSKQLFATVGLGDSDADLSWRALAEIAYTVLPGFVWAGLTCFVVAIGLRTYEANVARRAGVGPSSASGTEAAEQRPEAPLRPEAPPLPEATTLPEALEGPPSNLGPSRTSGNGSTDDISRFMRPPAAR